MTSDSALSAVPVRAATNRRRRRKSIARLFGAFSVPTNEALRANCLRDGCAIPLDLDDVRPDCLLPADVADLYAETADSQDSTSNNNDVSAVTKATVYVRLNLVRIAVCENQSIEIEMGVFDQNAERFLTDNIVLSSATNSLSDWVGFLDVAVTPSCIVVVRIYAIGGLVKNCSSVRECRRQIGFSSVPLMRVLSEAPLTQFELTVSRPKTDQSFAKLLTSSAASSRCSSSTAFQLRLQMANLIPLGTPYHSLSFQSMHMHSEPPSLIRFDIISGEFKNALKTSQMNICIEASVIVRGTTKELACLRRGSQAPQSSYQSGIVYHCNAPAFHENFTINLDSIRREVPDAHVSLLLRALHVARCGTVKTVGYVTLVVFDNESGKIVTTSDQVVGVQLLNMHGNGKTKNRIHFRSSIISKHDTDDDVLALILKGKARYIELKLAHSRIQNAFNLDALLIKKLMEHYIGKCSEKRGTTVNAAWSLYCRLRKRQLDKSNNSFDPVQADVLIANMITCFELDQVYIIQLSLEIFHDPSSFFITELSKILAPSLVDKAAASSGAISGRSCVLFFKFLANFLPPDQLRAAFDKFNRVVHHSEDLSSIIANFGHVSEPISAVEGGESFVAQAIRIASVSDEACYYLVKPLSTLLKSFVPESCGLGLLKLLHRLFRLSRKRSNDEVSLHVHILTIQAVRALHMCRITIPSSEIPIFLSYISRVADTTAFDSANIVLRVMELHSATLVLDKLSAIDSKDISIAETLLKLLIGKDMGSHRVRKRRSNYIYQHVHKWLRPWLLNILLRFSAVSPNRNSFELLLRFIIREKVLSEEMRQFLEKWQIISKERLYEHALCNEIYLLITDRWLYANVSEFFQHFGGWESTNFQTFFKCLTHAHSELLEENGDRKTDALISALRAVEHLDEALQIRLYVIDELVGLYENMQVATPELAQCLLERGESQPSTHPGRLSDFQKALQISTECFEWEKAAMICERIIYGYTSPHKDPSSVPYFRRIRADLLRRIQTEDRVMPHYARVAFNECNSHDASERGREFIYRLRIGESVLEFTHWFRMHYPYAQIKNTYLDPNQDQGEAAISIQRVEVLKYCQHEEENSESNLDSPNLPARFRHFAMHSDANAFSFARVEAFTSNTPGVPMKVDHEISDQWYEIHSVTVAHKFPYLSRRQLIVDHTKYWQSPIETAILAVRQGTQRLQREMEKIVFAAKQKEGNIDVGQLSLVLSGIIDAPVNGGIAVYKSCFLANCERYSSKQQDLINAIAYQGRVLKKALNLFKDSVSSELLPLYTHLECQLQKTFLNS